MAVVGGVMEWNGVHGQGPGVFLLARVLEAQGADPLIMKVRLPVTITMVLVRRRR